MGKAQAWTGSSVRWLQSSPVQNVNVTPETQQEIFSKSIAPGTILDLQPGHYAALKLTLAGTAEAPIVIRGRDKQTTFMDPGPADIGIYLLKSQYVLLENLTVKNHPRAGISIRFSNHIAVRNCQVLNNGNWGIFTSHSDHLLIENNQCSGTIKEHGIYVSNSGDYVTLRGNRCFDNQGSGVQVNGDLSMGGDGICSFFLIESNDCFDNGGCGFNLDGLSDSMIRRNRIWNNRASGIALFKGDAATGARRNQVLKNVIVQPPDGRWCININRGSTGNKLKENILITRHAFRGVITVDSSSLPGFASAKNQVIPIFSADGEKTRIGLWEWQALGYGKGTQTLTPRQIGQWEKTLESPIGTGSKTRQMDD